MQSWDWERKETKQMHSGILHFSQCSHSGSKGLTPRTGWCYGKILIGQNFLEPMSSDSIKKGVFFKFNGWSFTFLVWTFWGGPRTSISTDSNSAEWYGTFYLGVISWVSYHVMNIGHLKVICTVPNVAFYKEPRWGRGD